MKYKSEIHGGDVYRIARRYGLDPNQVLDFSGNINPLGIASGLKEYLLDRMDEISHYPDMEYRNLREAIAIYSDCPNEYVMVGNGATELIFLLFKAIRPKKVLIPSPTFGEYERAMDQVSAGAYPYRIKEEQDFNIDVQDLISELGDSYDMLILCNPNNPTGKLIKHHDLLEILDYTREHGIYVLIDETFVEFTADFHQDSLSSEITRYRNAIVLRGFAKFFSIPGLRLGYCIANPSLLAEMQKWKEPWTVNSVADIAAPYLLRHTDFIRLSREWITQERKFLFENLGDFDEWKVFESEANFFLIKILKASLTSAVIKENLESKGILIRDASSFLYLDQSFFRVAIRDRKDNVRLLQGLKEIVEKVSCLEH